MYTALPHTVMAVAHRAICISILHVYGTPSYPYGRGPQVARKRRRGQETEAARQQRLAMHDPARVVVVSATG
jgi:hypothetical protein